MLRSIEVTSELVTSNYAFHNLHFTKSLEISLDCCICLRTHRTQQYRLGAEAGICSGPRDVGSHPMAGRVSAFDRLTGPDSVGLRLTIEYWWSPFADLKDQTPATPLTDAPWVRLRVGYRCPNKETSHETTTQSNMVRPSDIVCESCEAVIASSADAPRIVLLN